MDRKCGMKLCNRQRQMIIIKAFAFSEKTKFTIMSTRKLTADCLNVTAVSYTHLDVYKRQKQYIPGTTVLIR